MLKPETKCNLCGNNRHITIFEANKDNQNKKESYSVTEGNLAPPQKILKCLGCGLIFSEPPENIATLVSLYKDYIDEEYINTESCRRHTAKNILRKLDKFRRNGNKLLEVGCSAGFFIDEAQKAGWEAYGVEPSKWAAEYAQGKFNLKIYNETLKKAQLPTRYFDVAVMLDTIEHLPDPKEALNEIYRILKPTGVLYITTPDIESLSSKLLKAKWWGINQFHLFYFSKTTLDKMLGITGFKSIKFISLARSFKFSYWLERFKNYNHSVYTVLKFMMRSFSLQDKLLTLNLKDQMEVLVRKRRTLEWINEFEEIEKIEVKKKETKTIVVLPAYNAAKTLKNTLDAIPKEVVDEIILVDDCSKDNTVEVARGLGLKVFTHKNNLGYGANQKTCYKKALELGADIVVMVHPDYQYDPSIIKELIAPIKEGRADAVFGSRMMKGGALSGGMPLWKHNANILLTAIENVILGTYLTEYHSGFRAYSAKLLRSISYELNSDGFVFDTEIIVQIILKYFRIEEVPIRTRYFDEASSIKLCPSIIYGLQIMKTLLKYTLHTHNIIRFGQFK